MENEEEAVKQEEPVRRPCWASRILVLAAAVVAVASIALKAMQLAG
ncbi:MAG: hypothetical protein ACI362_04370 [Coriobacteriales bacterium]